MKLPAIDGGYFGDPKPKPVPEQPTHCRGCGDALEPLRRYAGLCARCVRANARPVLAPTARIVSKLRVTRHFHKEGRRGKGHTEHFVELVCTCGRKAELRWSTWKHRPPKSCRHCRAREVDEHGFEAEHGR